MKRVMVKGIGAVSPAGWGVPALCAAVARGEPLPAQSLNRPGWKSALPTRLTPPLDTRPEFMFHPRLRRASQMTQHLVAAAVEALGDDLPAVQAGQSRLGIVVSLMAGCVAYSRRFFEEILQSPATASPMIFPETVFNAPSSHLAAFLNSPARSYTLVSDDAGFLNGLAIATSWLQDGVVDTCLLIGAEESDWIVLDALSLFQKSWVHADGAGALYLSTTDSNATPAELTCITDVFSYVANQSPVVAAGRMSRQLIGAGGNDGLLVECARGIDRMDQAEQLAWADWPGARLAPRRILGEGFCAAAAWQCVAAIEAIRRGEHAAANVSMVGVNQQAIGARFARVNSGIS